MKLKGISAVTSGTIFMPIGFIFKQLDPSNLQQVGWHKICKVMTSTSRRSDF